jgi:hypothetical protein
MHGIVQCVLVYKLFTVYCRGVTKSCRLFGPSYMSDRLRSQDPPLCSSTELENKENISSFVNCMTIDQGVGDCSAGEAVGAV